MQLRPYQQAAVNATYDYLRTHDGNPCIVIPTGGGKTPIMAHICRQCVGWRKRVLVLSHSKQLIKQTANTICAVDSTLELGVYSAGLNQRDLGKAITLAGIQSVYKIGDQLGHIDLVLVDEAHMIPVRDEGMYRTLLLSLQTTNPRLRVVGLTATPYRTGTGLVCGDENVLNDISHETGVLELIEQGYLSKLKNKGAEIDASSLKVASTGDYTTDSMDAIYTDTATDGRDPQETAQLANILDDLIEKSEGRKQTLIFTPSIRTMEVVASGLFRRGHLCGRVNSEQLDHVNEAMISEFRAGEIRYLANVSMLTTGFDLPTIDCIALLRPTISPGLYYQMVGRGFRIADGKDNCLVLDYGNNIVRHGCVDSVQPSTAQQAERKAGKASEPRAKLCPKCGTYAEPGDLKCADEDCNYEWPLNLDQSASAAPLLTPDATQYESAWKVVGVQYREWTSNKTGSTTMRVDYLSNAHRVIASEWECPEHRGYTRSKFLRWWGRRSDEAAPRTASKAVEIAKAGGLAEPSEIVVRNLPNERFAKIVSMRLGVVPVAEVSTDGESE